MTARCRAAATSAYRSVPQDQDERELPLEFPESLVPSFRFGAARGQYLRGAIAANVVLVCAGCCLLVVAGFAMLALQQRASSGNGCAAFLFGESSSRRAERSVFDVDAAPIRLTLSAAADRVRMPGAVFVASSVAAAGLATSGTALLSSMESLGLLDALLGAGALLVLVGLLGGSLLATRHVLTAETLTRQRRVEYVPAALYKRKQNLTTSLSANAPPIIIASRRPVEVVSSTVGLVVYRYLLFGSGMWTATSELTASLRRTLQKSHALQRPPAAPAIGTNLDDDDDDDDEKCNLVLRHWGILMTAYRALPADAELRAILASEARRPGRVAATAAALCPYFFSVEFLLTVLTAACNGLSFTSCRLAFRATVAISVVDLVLVVAFRPYGVPMKNAIRIVMAMLLVSANAAGLASVEATGPDAASEERSAALAGVAAQVAAASAMVSLASTAISISRFVVVRVVLRAKLVADTALLTSLTATYAGAHSVFANLDGVALNSEVDPQPVLLPAPLAPLVMDPDLPPPVDDDALLDHLLGLQHRRDVKQLLRRDNSEGNQDGPTRRRLGSLDDLLGDTPAERGLHPK